MELLKEEVRSELFMQPGRSIYTKVRDSMPTKYGENASVRNSLIADDCFIDGVVENSILFRGTKVLKGAVIRNSILMQDTIVQDNIVLDHVITDKNVKIMHRENIIGQADNIAYVRKDGLL
ncbi:MAG: hypothetical protein GX661_04345 [Acholeplasmataceae bacterium]|nr:hypothetical protein [Acholeplasmataceae bacterium]